MIDSDKIDAFYDGDLSDAEKDNLMESIEADPKLRAEFEFQGELIEGIKSFRKAELIAKLNTVQIAPVAQHLAAKIIGGVIMVSAIGLGTYLFLQPDKEIKSTQPIPLEQTTDQSLLTEENQSLSDNQSTIDDQISSSTPDSTEPQTDEQANDLSQHSAASPSVVVPEVVDGFEETGPAADDDVSAPKNTTSADVNRRHDVDISVKISKKYNFHYQLSESKLILFGEFEEEPFEIIELNRASDIKLFLYYKKDYYVLESGSDKIQPLVRVNDLALIEKLNSLREG